MSRLSFLRASLAWGLFGFLALKATIAFAQSSELSGEALNRLTNAYAELRRQNPELEERSPARIAADAQQILRARRERMPDTSVVTARSVVSSVAAAARCQEGYVVNGNHRASAAEVRIVAAERRECDGGRCRSFQVTAARDTTEPFDLEVSVTCS
jgi:hypothetical protein